jgi:Tfp pilus assembly protein PilF
MANPNSRLLLIRAMLIVSAAFWVYAPALHGDWIMDDNMYVTQNALLNDPARLWKIWFVPGSLVEYYPIEASLQAIQWYLWHMDTLGYHLTNLILHIVGSMLVWRLLSKFGLRFAWLGGLLFAVHPAAVESVAYISEFKNVLSLPPFLLAMCAWIDFDERRQPRDYFLALGFFLLAMLCKISMALFPFLILLYAWWKRRRIGWRDLQVSAPFFAISFVLGLTTIVVGQRYLTSHLQSGGNPDIGGFPAHLSLAGWSIAFYFFKCLWPANMSPVYPQWPLTPLTLTSFLPWPILAGVLFLLWTQRVTWGRHALLGLGFFLLNLLPFVGLNSVSYMGYTWVMDHFLYIPIIGLIGLVIALLGEIDVRMTSRNARYGLAGATAATFALLALQSQLYAENYAGPEKLWTYAIKHNPNSWMVYSNLGVVLLETGRNDEAIRAYNKALELNPKSVEAHNNLGLALFQMGKTDEAIANYRSALEYNPHFGITLTNLGNALAKAGRSQEAVAKYREALKVNPNDSDARAGLAKLQALQNSH